MKSLVISLLLLTGSYSKSLPNVGGGIGYGEGRLSFNCIYEFDGKYNAKKPKRDRYFMAMAGNFFFNGRNDENSYDFSEDLFSDKDLGKISECIFVVGGLVHEQGNYIDLYLGGGTTFISEYFKKEDESEILGSEGYYFVEDDDGMTWHPSLSIGLMTKSEPTTNGIKKIGFLLNLNPLFLNIAVLF